VNRFGAIVPLLLPAAILLIPYADLLMAVVRRTRAGTSPFSADMKHLHHRMLAIGHSHKASVLLMYLWAALFAGSVAWLSIVRTSLFILIIVTGAAVVALGLLLVSMPRLRPWVRRAAQGDGAVAGSVPGRAAPPAVLPVAAARRAVPAQIPPAEPAPWPGYAHAEPAGSAQPSEPSASPAAEPRSWFEPAQPNASGGVDGAAAAPGPGGPNGDATGAPGPGGPNGDAATAPGPGGPNGDAATAPGPGGPNGSAPSLPEADPRLPASLPDRR
jgi:UDP-GlcNAc:undecaprenyl-phosphate/decaprenyl-phosphate GlcNAc-1-phosphate transferase